MITSPAGAYPVTNRHDVKYARGIGRMSLDAGFSATGRRPPEIETPEAEAVIPLRSG
jgi:hypothetical protein